MSNLSSYYILTDEFKRTLRGEVNLVVGRKGSGKTALFIQMRNTKREDKQNVVIDLKPEGYQLIKLKEYVLNYLTPGSQQHLLTALWEYILLLEVARKVLDKDDRLHLRDHRLTAKYERLRELYGVSNLAGEGDFSERLHRLSDVVAQDYRAKFADTTNVTISQNEVTELIYKHNIRALVTFYQIICRTRKRYGCCLIT